MTLPDLITRPDTIPLSIDEESAFEAIVGPIQPSSLEPSDPSDLIISADDVRQILRVLDALREFVYETTHLSREEEDGSHWCRIPKATLEKGRAAVRSRLPTPQDGERDDVCRSKP